MNRFDSDAAKTLIDEYYEYAKKQEYIQSPLAWAVYQVWRKIEEYGEKSKADTF